MQTFLPFSDYNNTAWVLDNKRLGKQRVESLQIMKALIDPGYGWRTHPATVMWAPYPDELLHYTFAICREWRKRGFNDTVTQKIWVIFISHFRRWPRKQKPIWIGDERLHISHQSSLKKKDPEFYQNYFKEAPEFTEYFWPSNSPDYNQHLPKLN